MDYIIYFQITRQLGEMVPLDTHGVCLLRKKQQVPLQGGMSHKNEVGLYPQLYIYKYNTIHYIALHCITLHYITLHNITKHYIPLHTIT